MLSRLDTIPECADGWTDRQNCCNNIRRRIDSHVDARRKSADERFLKYLLEFIQHYTTDSATVTMESL